MSEQKFKEEKEITIISADAEEYLQKVPNLHSSQPPSDQSDLATADRDVLQSVATNLFAGRFEILASLGIGGMSEVFKVREKDTNRVLALKMIKPERAKNEGSLERLQHEARIISKLGHPNICSLKEAGQDANGRAFLVMDYVEGMTLAELLHQDGAFTLERALSIICQVCDGLSHAQERGIIHGDIKPSNIIVSKQPDGSDRVHIVDFGIGSIFDQVASAHVPLTETRETMGTPCYMSPEQCFAQVCDARSDIYQTGCLFYELLTGKPPFQGRTSFEIMFKHVTDSPSLDGLPSSVRGILLRCFAKNPEDRYQHAAELRSDLKRLPCTGRSLLAILSGQEPELKNEAAVFLLFCKRLAAGLIDALFIGLLSSILACVYTLVTSVISDHFEGFNLNQCYLAMFSFKLGFLDAICVWTIPLAVVAMVCLPGFVNSKIAYSFGLFMATQEYSMLLPVLLITNWLYHAIFESKKFRATPGKIILGLAVQSEQTGQVSFAQASRRHFSKILTMIFLPEIARFFSGMVRSHRKPLIQLKMQLSRPLHDLLCETRVAPAATLSKHRKITCVCAIFLTAAYVILTLPFLAYSAGNWNAAIFINPRFVEAYRQRATEHMRHRRLAQAVSDLTVVAKLSTWPDISSQKAACLYELGDYAGAVAASRGFEQARLLASRGSFAGALAICHNDRSNDAFDKGADDNLFMANLCAAAGEKEKANYYYNMVLNSKLAPGPELLGFPVALMALGRNTDAIEFCNKFGSQMQSESNCEFRRGSFYLIRAQLYESQADRTLTLENLNQCIRCFDRFINSNHLDFSPSIDSSLTRGKAYLRRATALDMLHQPQAAEKDRQTAARLGVKVDIWSDNDGEYVERMRSYKSLTKGK